MRKAIASLFLLMTLLLQATSAYADVSAAPPPPSKSENNVVFPVEDLFEEARKPDDKFFVEVLNMVTTLGLIIGLILIVAWFLKRMVNTKLDQANLTSTIKVIERRTLSPKTSIYLIEIHEKTIALAESAEGVALLTEFPFTLANREIAKNELNPSFKEILDQKNSTQ